MRKSENVIVGRLSADCRPIIDGVMSTRLNGGSMDFNYDILLFRAMCGMYLNVQGMAQDVYLKEVEWSE